MATSIEQSHKPNECPRPRTLFCTIMLCIGLPVIAGLTALTIGLLRPYTPTPFVPRITLRFPDDTTKCWVRFIFTSTNDNDTFSRLTVGPGNHNITRAYPTDSSAWKLDIEWEIKYTSNPYFIVVDMGSTTQKIQKRIPIEGYGDMKLIRVDNDMKQFYGAYELVYLEIIVGKGGLTISSDELLK